MDNLNSECGSTSPDDLSPDVVLENVRKLAKHKGVTLKKMCSEAGVSYHTLGNQFTYRRLPNLETLYNLAIWGGISIDSLLGREGQLVLEEDEADLVECCRNDSSKRKLWQWICSLDDEAASVIHDLTSLLHEDSKR